MKHATEYSLRQYALQDNNISIILTQKCRESRNVNYKCDGNCADKFSTTPEAFQAVKKLRQSIWVDPESMNFTFSTNNNGGLDIRKSAFMKAIINMSTTNETGDIVINYTIEGKLVCKFFYFKATGFSSKIFNRGISFMLSNDNENKNEHEYSDFSTLSTKPIFAHICGHNTCFPQKTYRQKVKEHSDGEQEVISFLDLFFKGHRDVDNAPEESNVKYVRLQWIAVYEEYVKRCKLIPVKAIPYNLFTSIR